MAHELDSFGAAVPPLSIANKGCESRRLLLLVQNGRVLGLFVFVFVFVLGGNVLVNSRSVRHKYVASLDADCKAVCMIYVSKPNCSDRNAHEVLSATCEDLYSFIYVQLKTRTWVG